MQYQCNPKRHINAFRPSTFELPACAVCQTMVAGLALSDFEPRPSCNASLLDSLLTCVDATDTAGATPSSNIMGVNTRPPAAAAAKQDSSSSSSSTCSTLECQCSHTTGANPSRNTMGFNTRMLAAHAMK
jgi:hypothetical protein